MEKYANEDSLYPKDLMLRTKVNERLMYVATYIFPRLYQIFVPGYFGVEKKIPGSKVAQILRGYKTINTFLDGNDYLTGDTLTLADLFLWACMESLEKVIPIGEEKFPNFDQWLNRVRKLPSYEVNKEGGDVHVEFYEQCLDKPLDIEEFKLITQ